MQDYIAVDADGHEYGRSGVVGGHINPTQYADAVGSHRINMRAHRPIRLFEVRTHRITNSQARRECARDARQIGIVDHDVGQYILATVADGYLIAERRAHDA